MYLYNLNVIPGALLGLEKASQRFDNSKSTQWFFCDLHDEITRNIDGSTKAKIFKYGSYHIYYTIEQGENACDVVIYQVSTQK